MSEQQPPKKTFSPRSIAFDEFRRKQVSAFGGRAFPPEEHLMILEDHLGVSLRRRWNAFPLFKLQMALLTDLIDAEKAVAACKTKLEEVKAEAETRQREQDIESLEAQQQMHSAIRRALRDIGDGIAWRLFDYDRASLSVLATHARKPHVNLDGLAAELGALAELWNQTQGLAILNDLTHFLKKADLTFRHDANNFEFVEVKSSRTKSGTLSRQRADLVETLNFLTEGEGERRGETVRLRSVPVRPAAYFKAVEPVLKEAQRTGTASAVIGEHLTVEFVDWITALDSLPDLTKLEKVRAVADRWAKGGDIVIRSFGTDRYHLVRNFAPYSIYPFDPMLRVKLMTGTMVSVSRLNISAVVRYIASKGWTIVRGPESHLSEAASEDEPRDVPVATFKKGGLTLELPTTFLARIAHEYLAPRSIVEAFEALLRAGPGEAGSMLINFEGEADLWD
ncbi:MAG: hypothetical protein ABR567_08675 [Myxococcales bacterium]